MRERFASYIVGALRHLFSWNYEDTEVLEAALAATGLSPLAQADVLLEGIERQGERISADLLYTLTGLIAARTPAKDRAGLIDALLSRVEARTSHPSIVCLAGVEPPQDVAECVARTLFAAMGDMDRRIRWRACHAALVLLHGRDPAWEKLVACLTKDHEAVFAGAHFYRYAALEQLMLVLQRAAQKNARAVESHAATILEIIGREPHVIVRELGRVTLLALDDAGLGRLTEIDRILVQQLNRSQLPPRAARKNLHAKRPTVKKVENVSTASIARTQFLTGMSRSPVCSTCGWMPFSTGWSTGFTKNGTTTKRQPTGSRNHVCIVFKTPMR